RKKVLHSAKALAGCGKSTRRPLGAPHSVLASLATRAGSQGRAHLVQQRVSRLEPEARLDAGPGSGRIAEIQGCRSEQALQGEVVGPACHAERGHLAPFRQAAV